MQYRTYIYLEAVVTIASIDSIILCRAESVPMVISVPQKSLSIEPTIPTILRWPHSARFSGLIIPIIKNFYNFIKIFMEKFILKQWNS